ncbi:MAG TPA: M6 family metalloprotease domain-containing protein, partial [bacterium]|nr:M6 family metalloprotease domain-containing protein [bacterium]
MAGSAVGIVLLLSATSSHAEDPPVLPSRETPHCVALPHWNESDGPAQRLAMNSLQRNLRAPLFGPAPGNLRPVRAKGSARLLVILAEFSGKPHRIQPSRFQTLLFGGSNSMASYYDAASEGDFELTGTIHGWVGLPQTQAYYSANQGGIGSYPENGQKMAEDAVQAAIAQGLQLGDYDADDDGFVDALLVVHSGQGLEWCASSNNTPQPDLSAINSHKWVVQQQTYAGQGAKVGEYFTCPELQIIRSTISPGWADSISTIGVYCHEFGHLLGLPDMYDVESGDARIGVWDLMDSGSWNPIQSFSLAPGASPSEFSAWSKIFLDWVDPKILAPKAGEIHNSSETLLPLGSGHPPLQLLENSGGVDWRSGTPGHGEYFLAELRSRIGFDGGLPDSGVLIYHVDESRFSNRGSDNPDGGGLIVLVPQDAVVGLSLVDSRGDSWPGAQDELSEQSNPSSRRFNGTASGLTLSSIAVNGGTSATLNVSITNLDPMPPFPFARPNPWHTGQTSQAEIVLHALNQQAAQGTSIAIHDLAGRLLQVLDD